MKIRYIPESATSINGVLHLDIAVKNLVTYARKDFQKVKAQHEFRTSGKCPTCGYGPLPFHIHHTKPMWAYAVDLLIRHAPQNVEELKQLSSMAFSGKINILECNSLSNLEHICQLCHTKKEVETELQWKDYFRAKRVLFHKSEIVEVKFEVTL